MLAIGELPYIIYMTINWSHTLIDYDPMYIMVTAQPLPLQLKISATVTVGIALSRNIVSFYNKTSHENYGRHFTVFNFQQSSRRFAGRLSEAATC